MTMVASPKTALAGIVTSNSPFSVTEELLNCVLSEYVTVTVTVISLASI